MTTRKKNGRTIVTSPPTGKAHGRPLATTPAIRTRLDPGDPAERLAYALVEHHLVRRGVKVDANANAIKRRIDRAREDLRLTPTGAEEARQITSGLTANGGGLLRTVETAHPDARGFAARAAVRFVALVREHDVTSTAALVSLASAAQWSALGEMLRDEMHAIGPKGDGFGERLKQATACSTAARLDLLGGLQLEREAKEAKPRATFPWQTPATGPAALPATVSTPDEPAIDPEPTSEDDGAPEDEADEGEGPEEDAAEPGFGSREEHMPTTPNPYASAVPPRDRTIETETPRETRIAMPQVDNIGRPIISARGGPTQAARDLARREHGLVWDDARQTWTKAPNGRNRP
jgi:hypothetical protein